jgi:hypothetical protein
MRHATGAIAVTTAFEVMEPGCGSGGLTEVQTARHRSGPGTGRANAVTPAGDPPLLQAHYAIRSLLHDAADPAGHDPDRMSFIKGLRVVRGQVTDQAAITP